MTDSFRQLSTAVREIRGSGSFFMKGSVGFVFPGISLPDGEELAFPLPPSQARYLESVAEWAPYGKGEETVTDPGVRQSRQIDADDLRWNLPEWDLLVSILAERAAAELGVEGEVSAIPYKLLLYGEGGHFRPHRDTEKAPGMFGSMLVSLPSEHTGGELLVRHDGREASVSFAGGEWRNEIRYAAFYADCEHEVRPVRSGYRLCLAYHLTRASGGSVPAAPTVSANAATLQAPLAKLKRERPDELSAVLLEHAYTGDSFSVKALKGDDRARSHGLFHAAKEAGFRAHLGLVSLYQMGELDDYGKDETMGEIYDESLSVDEWRTPADRNARLGCFAIAEDCLVSGETLGEGEPTESYAEGFTGNAGCTMEYWYRRAAAVLWPKEADAAIRARYDFSATAVDFLETARRKGESAGQSLRFRELGNALLDTGLDRIAKRESESPLRRFRSFSGELAPVFEGIARSGSTELFDRIPRKVLLGILLDGSPSLMAATLDAFGSDAVVALLSTSTEDGTTRQRRDAFFFLLDAVLRRLPEHRDLAVTMTSHLPAFLDEELADEQQRYRRRLADAYYDSWDDEKEGLPLPVRIRLAIAATALIGEPKDRDRVHDALRSRGRLRHLRDILAPALLIKDGKDGKKSLSSLGDPGSLHRPLLDEAVADLRTEVETALEPYPDWTRPIPDASERVSPDRFSPVRADAFLEELETFLTDPDSEEHRFRQRQEIRSLLEKYIHQNRLDLDLRTEKKGSPHTLVCTKNDHSYHKGVRRRKKDRDLLGKLEAL